MAPAQELRLQGHQDRQWRRKRETPSIAKHGAPAPAADAGGLEADGAGPGIAQRCFSPTHETAFTFQPNSIPYRSLPDRIPPDRAFAGGGSLLQTRRKAE